MPIVVNLDVVMAQRKVRLSDLAEAIGVTATNLSILKTGKARAIRFSTLESLCRALQCQPGEILAYQEEAPTGFALLPKPPASMVPATAAGSADEV